MSDLISRQAAIDAIEKNAYRHTYIDQIIDIVSELPSVQPDITLELAIDYLHSIGWMQSHDKQMYEDGQRSAQPDIIHCRDCKHWDRTWKSIYGPNYHYCPIIAGTFSGNFYCADAERRTDE